MAIELGDYIDVAARIAEFRSKHPDGSLQPANLERPYTVENIGDQTFIVVVSAAYRTSDDQRPGIGMAYELFPGRTPYTRGSELQNAETSAWGRAIVAALAADTKRGIASADEVRNRSAEREQQQDPAKAKAKAELWKAAKEMSWDAAKLAAAFAEENGGAELSAATVEQLNGMRDFLRMCLEASAEQEASDDAARDEAAA